MITDKIGAMIKSRAFVMVAVAAFGTIQIYDDTSYTRGVIREGRRQAAYWVVNQTAMLDDAYEYDHAQPTGKVLKVAKK